MGANLVADKPHLVDPTRNKQDLVQTVLVQNGILVRTKMTLTLAPEKPAKAVRMAVHLMTVSVRAFVHLVSLILVPEKPAKVAIMAVHLMTVNVQAFVHLASLHLHAT